MERETAVWVSDTHLAGKNYGFARHIAAKVKDLRPDVVLSAGTSLTVWQSISTRRL